MGKIFFTTILNIIISLKYPLKTTYISRLTGKKEGRRE